MLGSFDTPGLAGDRDHHQPHPDAAVIVPARAGAVASASAEIEPTQRDRHPRMISERGRIARQTASGYNLRANGGVDRAGPLKPSPVT
jgi:hypothetical protein